MTLAPHITTKQMRQNMTRLLDEEPAPRTVGALLERLASTHGHIDVGRAFPESSFQMRFHGEVMFSFLSVTHVVKNLAATTNINKHRHVTNTRDESSCVFATCRTTHRTCSKASHKHGHVPHGGACHKHGDAQRELALRKPSDRASSELHLPISCPSNLY